VNSSKYWFLQQKEGWMAICTTTIMSRASTYPYFPLPWCIHG
jgi:hypothetical protein